MEPTVNLLILLLFMSGLYMMLGLLSLLLERLPGLLKGRRRRAWPGVGQQPLLRPERPRRRRPRCHVPADAEGTHLV